MAARRVSSSVPALTTLYVPLLSAAVNALFHTRRSKGRQVVEVQFEPGEVYKTWYPNVRRVRRTVSYVAPNKRQAIERTIYW